MDFIAGARAWKIICRLTSIHYIFWAGNPDDETTGFRRPGKRIFLLVFRRIPNLLARLAHSSNLFKIARPLLQFGGLPPTSRSRPSENPASPVVRPVPRHASAGLRPCVFRRSCSRPKTPFKNSTVPALPHRRSNTRWRSTCRTGIAPPPSSPLPPRLPRILSGRVRSDPLRRLAPAPSSYRKSRSHDAVRRQSCLNRYPARPRQASGPARRGLVSLPVRPGRARRSRIGGSPPLS